MSCVRSTVGRRRPPYCQLWGKLMSSVFLGAKMLPSFFMQFWATCAITSILNCWPSGVLILPTISMMWRRWPALVEFVRIEVGGRVVGGRVEVGRARRVVQLAGGGGGHHAKRSVEAWVEICIWGWWRRAGDENLSKILGSVSNPSLAFQEVQSPVSPGNISWNTDHYTSSFHVGPVLPNNILLH